VTRSIITASDLTLIPVRPSPYDVWAAEETISLLEDVMTFKETLKTFFLINRKITRTVIGRDVIEALGDFKIPVLQSRVSQRSVFAETAREGKTVLEVEPHGYASDEISALIREIAEEFDA
jgi:chromosome partitioning protein